MNQDHSKVSFNYLYRDKGNWKLFNSLVYTNPENLELDEIEKQVRKELIDGEFFYPDVWGVPKLKFEKYDSELDHRIHEFMSVAPTNDLPTDKLTIREFISKIQILNTSF